MVKTKTTEKDATKNLDAGMKKKAKKALEEGTKKVTMDDLEDVLEKQDELEEKFKIGGPLGRFIEDFKLLIALIKAYVRGEYREIPFWSIAAVVAALLYIINPVDLIPDWIPIIGLVDDAFVLGICLKMIEKDLFQFKEWKKRQELAL